MHKLSYDPNVVQFYGACLDPVCPMLVLEYMEGGDLHSCIVQDCYPKCKGFFRWYRNGARVALDVAKGLVFLHDQQVPKQAVLLLSALQPLLALCLCTVMP